MKPLSPRHVSRNLAHAEELPCTLPKGGNGRSISEWQAWRASQGRPVTAVAKGGYHGKRIK